MDTGFQFSVGQLTANKLFSQPNFNCSCQPFFVFLLAHEKALHNLERQEINTRHTNSNAKAHIDGKILPHKYAHAHMCKWYSKPYETTKLLSWIFKRSFIFSNQQDVLAVPAVFKAPVRVDVESPINQIYSLFPFSCQCVVSISYSMWTLNRHVRSPISC